MADRSRIEELRRRVRLDPASVLFAGLAEEYRKAGLFEESVAACRAGLEQHPTYITARVTLGRSLLALGRYEEAWAELEHVRRAAPDNLAATRALAHLHLQLQRDSEPQQAGVLAPADPLPSLSPAIDAKDRVLTELEALLASVIRARAALPSRGAHRP